MSVDETLDPDLVAILACPDCRAALVDDHAARTLSCTGCGLVYPVQHGIPVLLIDQASRPDVSVVNTHDPA